MDKTVSSLDLYYFASTYEVPLADRNSIPVVSFHCKIFPRHSFLHLLPYRFRLWNSLHRSQDKGRHSLFQRVSYLFSLYLIFSAEYIPTSAPSQRRPRGTLLRNFPRFSGVSGSPENTSKLQSCQQAQKVQMIRHLTAQWRPAMDILSWLGCCGDQTRRPIP